MGWLFAVSNGMFERRDRAVFSALPPIALGHFLAMSAVLLPVAVVSTLAARFDVVRVSAGLLIIAFGVYRLAVRRHPRVLSRIGAAHLTLWSFVMATAHGAALMLVPVYFGMARMPAAQMSGPHAAPMTALASLGSGVAQAGAVAIVHTLAMLVVAGAIAWVFYRYVGVAMLRSVWFNVDLVWGAVLIAAGIIALLAPI